jgi:hypothetical protein
LIFFSQIDNLGRDLAPLPIKNDELVAALHAQHIARVMRFASAQDERIRIPIFG